MKNFEIRPSARQDLEGIWLYTAETWDENQAENYLSQLRDAFQQIADMPGTGQDVSNIRPGYRKYSVEATLFFICQYQIPRLR